MFGCNDTITLWHKVSGKGFVRSVLPVKCKWRSRAVRNVTESGENVKQYATVVIPYDSHYIFDGKVGDYIALGEHEVEITGKEPFRVDEVKKLLYPNFYGIDNIKDDTNSSVGKRYKVEGIL